MKLDIKRRESTGSSFNPHPSSTNAASNRPISPSLPKIHRSGLIPSSSKTDVLLQSLAGKSVFLQLQDNEYELSRLKYLFCIYIYIYIFFSFLNVFSLLAIVQFSFSLCLYSFI